MISIRNKNKNIQANKTWTRKNKFNQLTHWVSTAERFYL